MLLPKVKERCERCKSKHAMQAKVSHAKREGLEEKKIRNAVKAKKIPPNA